ncbi:expressed unknown protein [Seminavis robusta]|uniref:Uncharacterized protein n=1 Tax=Seminavis robusta TaxID=568900 RepID=A0A9N8E5K0_9STRA|nr:expressed unknown protein [Seminavis robusta]|eukprot:Sro539_g162760.1 n/a (418) ;mRNA; f:6815-8068
MARRFGGRRGFLGRRSPGFLGTTTRRRHHGFGLNLVVPSANSNNGEDQQWVPSATQVAWLRRIQILPMLLSVSGIIFSLLLTLAWQHDHVTLHAGETRLVIPSFLSSALSFHVRDGRYVDTAVYALSSHECPPLTGPIHSIVSEHAMTLTGRYDYQYDSWHLNEGSNVRIAMETSGHVTVLLVQGEPSWKLMGGNLGESDFEKYRRNALATWLVDSNNNNNSVEFQVDRTDNYILIYGNGKGQFKAHYNHQLTSHNLQNMDPVCGNIRINGCPAISASHECIIVQTSRAKQDTRRKQEQDPTVLLTIEGSRRWIVLIMISLLPACCLMMACEVLVVKRGQQWQRVPLDDPDGNKDGDVQVVQQHNNNETHSLVQQTSSIELIPVAQAQVVSADNVMSATAVVEVPLQPMGSTVAPNR